ncbi:hypothetical protein RFI_00678 [Reticulomyxa filosa]|uniref:Uncharacterized protein n=1 Tax=Reticulomyxa filosa TaxID=46433 RepID=X6PEE0_RETFI|nr:hypothetical protein RFI_00678 [Reticulomyxa filosa]|eukprot:ETO36384.1 hypothetical protein RFI_00678 [Reticulomyxa filosa]
MNTLINGLKDKDKGVCESHAALLGVNALPGWNRSCYFYSYEKAFEEILMKLNENQSERIFDRLLMSFERISTKLNDKQLYLLVIHVLERMKKRFTHIPYALSKISKDMWKRLTIYGLKENIQLKNKNTLMNKDDPNNCIWKANDANIELFVFDLITCNSCIQLIISL